MGEQPCERKLWLQRTTFIKHGHIAPARSSSVDTTKNIAGTEGLPQLLDHPYTYLLSLPIYYASSPFSTQFKLYSSTFTFSLVYFQFPFHSFFSASSVISCKVTVDWLAGHKIIFFRS